MATWLVVNGRILPIGWLCMEGRCYLVGCTWNYVGYWLVVHGTMLLTGWLYMEVFCLLVGCAGKDISN